MNELYAFLFPSTGTSEFYLSTEEGKFILIKINGTPRKRLTVKYLTTLNKIYKRYYYQWYTREELEASFKYPIVGCIKYKR